MVEAIMTVMMRVMMSGSVHGCDYDNYDDYDDCDDYEDYEYYDRPARCSNPGLAHGVRRGTLLGATTTGQKDMRPVL